MKGAQAAQALTSYMGQTGIASAPSYSDVEIGGGRITGTETSIEHPNGTSFAMYHTDQYMAPEGNYETVTAADQTTWYRQYAADTVERIPYMTEKGRSPTMKTLSRSCPVCRSERIAYEPRQGFCSHCKENRRSCRNGCICRLERKRHPR